MAYIVCFCFYLGFRPECVLFESVSFIFYLYIVLLLSV